MDCPRGPCSVDGSGSVDTIVSVVLGVVARWYHNGLSSPRGPSTSSNVNVHVLSSVVGMRSFW